MHVQARNKLKVSKDLKTYMYFLVKIIDFSER